MRSDSGAADAGAVCGIVVVTAVVAAVPPGGDSRQDELAAARQATSRRHLPDMTINDSKYSRARRPWGEPTAERVVEDTQQEFHDRLSLVRHGRLGGPSRRTPHVNLDDAMKENSDQQADLVRISCRLSER